MSSAAERKDVNGKEPFFQRHHRAKNHGSPHLSPARQTQLDTAFDALATRGADALVELFGSRPVSVPDRGQGEIPREATPDRGQPTDWPLPSTGQSRRSVERTMDEFEGR